MISFGASGTSLSIVIDGQHIPDALNRLHAEFFDGISNNETFDAIGN
jgi:aspartokinase